MPSLSEVFLKKLPQWKVSGQIIVMEEACLTHQSGLLLQPCLLMQKRVPSTLASQARISTLKFHSF
jgi:hypothetical protein